MKEITWSHTRLSLWHQCPFAWRCRYLDHAAEAPSEVFYNGRRFHQAVSEYATHCLQIGRSTDYEVGRAVAARYTDIPDVRELVEAFVESYAFDVEHMVGLEQNLVADLPNGDRFQGVPDYLAIDGERARIVDWKTWRTWPVYNEDKPDPQLVRYAWLVQAMYPQVQSLTVALHFPRHGVTQEWQVWDPGCEEIVEAAEWIKREIRTRKKNRFEATPGGWCGLCGFTSICPKAAAILREGDARGAAEKLTVLDGERKRLLKLVGTWAKEVGPIELVEGAWEYAPAEKPSPAITDMEGLLAFLAAEGEDWLQQMTFSATLLKAWSRKYEDRIAPYLGEKAAKPTLKFRRTREDKGEATTGEEATA